jgi:mannose/fructose/N-acetylgalactosamine-specific phosphotransferase system component IID/mannose/fructose/N-acetylgalactosamine-specific phosphotransferase system component IIC
MQIWQAVLIAFIYFLGNSTLIGVGYFTLYRPLVAGFLTGLILGNPVMGTMIGASINLMYIGFISAGGSLPGDPALAGIVGTSLGITAGLGVEASLAIAVPLGLLGAFLWFGRLTLTTMFVPLGDRLAAKGDAKNFWIADFLLPQGLLFLISFVPCFLIVYYGADYVQGALNYLGANVLGILIIIGGMLPALGLGLTLKSVFSGSAKVYFFLGFLMIKYFGLNMVSLGFIAVILTVIYVQYTSKGEGNPFANLLSSKADKSVSIKHILTNSDLNKAFINWTFHAQSCYNYERMMGFGFLHSMVPVFKKLYKNDKEGMAEAMQRHTGFFNTAPQFGAIIPGLTIAMEEQKFQGASEIDESMITAVKTSLMGPLAGIGDTITQGVIVPILLAFFIGMSIKGNIAGPILYSISVTVIIVGMSYWLFRLGYNKGSEAIAQLLESGLINKVIDAAKVMGCIVIGGLVASYVSMKTGITVKMGDSTFKLQESLFDVILPGMLPLLLTLGCYKLIDKKVSTTKVMLLLIVVAIIGGMTHILA